jgi:hypothetical protein
MVEFYTMVGVTGRAHDVLGNGSVFTPASVWLFVALFD